MFCPVNRLFPIRLIPNILHISRRYNNLTICFYFVSKQILLTVLLFVETAYFSRGALYPPDGEDTHFLPYGSDAGDSTVPRSDDDSSGLLTLSIPFGFFGNNYNQLWVQKMYIN